MLLLFCCHAGRTSPDQAVQCNITCATDPCFVMPVGGVYADIYVRAPGPNTYTGGSLTFAVRCACTNCLGVACESQFWVPKDEAANCPVPKIGLDQTFYKPICRSNAPSTDYGWTGWVNSITCEGYQFSNSDYSVWCPEGECACSQMVFANTCVPFLLKLTLTLLCLHHRTPRVPVQFGG